VTHTAAQLQALIDRCEQFPRLRAPGAPLVYLRVNLPADARRGSLAGQRRGSLFGGVHG
jgi:hypothetical protein